MFEAGRGIPAENGKEEEHEGEGGAKCLPKVNLASLNITGPPTPPWHGPHGPHPLSYFCSGGFSEFSARLVQLHFQAKTSWSGRDRDPSGNGGRVDELDGSTFNVQHSTLTRRTYMRFGIIHC
jgi:hypothetical protein